VILIENGHFKKGREKGPKGIFKSPWGLHIGYFWKTLSINPPET